MSYFPMFVELKSQECLIVGGGETAWRKVRVLKEFGARIRLVAPQIMTEIREMPEISCEERDFEPSDVNGMKLVVAATNDKQCNHQVAELCRKQGIPVNAVDQIEDCSFIFPSYLKQDEVVAAFSSGGQSPVVTQYMKEMARPFMTEHLGRLAACLGSIREMVKQRVENAETRKYVYQELLQFGLEHGMIPSEEEIENVIGNCEKREEKKWSE